LSDPIASRIPHQQNRALLLYFLLAYAISWVLFAPLVLSRAGVGVLHVNISIAWSVVGTLGPTLAALIAQWRTEGNLRAFRFRTSWKRFALGAIAGPALTIVTYSILPALLLSLSPPASLNWKVFASLGVFNWSTLLGGPLFEEPGWRGFALPRMQARLGPVRASLVLGFLWAGWHAPLFLLKQWESVSPPVYAAILIGLSVVMTFGWNISRESIAVTVLMHATFNTTSIWLGGLLATAKTRDHADWILAGASLAAAACLAVATRGRLEAAKATSSP
jgi:membrane protease YdiL (CAAX protease family)